MDLVLMVQGLVLIQVQVLVLVLALLTVESAPMPAVRQHPPSSTILLQALTSTVMV